MELFSFASPARTEQPFVDFHSVNRDTNIHGLNLNWAEADLPEKDRTKHVHRLHPYLGKFIPQLVEIFLRKFRPGMVYDPFCGSGTTLVEASVLGVDSVGTDISAFNVLLTGVKTKRVDVDALENEAGRILSEVERLNAPVSQLGFFSNGKSAKNGQANEEPCSDYLKAWFAPQALKELLQYKELAEGSAYPDLFRIMLSRSARSARLVRHFDLDFPKAPQTEPYYCYKHSRTCSPTQSASKFLRRYTEDRGSSCVQVSGNAFRSKYPCHSWRFEGSGIAPWNRHGFHVSPVRWPDRLPRAAPVFLRTAWFGGQRE